MSNNTTTCLNSLAFTSTEQDVILNIRVSVASLSLLGSLIVILLILLCHKCGFYFQRLILYYGIASFLSSTAYIVGRVNYNATTTEEISWCKAQGIWLMYTDWVVLLCNFVLICNLMRGVFLLKNSVVQEILFLFCSFILPALPTCIPLYDENSYGPSGLWCWLRCEDKNSKLPFLGLYVWYYPLYTLIVIMFVMYLVVLVAIRIQKVRWSGLYDPINDESKKERFNNALSLIWYPCVLFLVNLFPFINRLYLFIFSRASFPLYVLHVIFSPLPGVLMLFVYAFDRETIRRLKWEHIKGFFTASVQTYPIRQTREDTGYSIRTIRTH